MKQIKFNAKVTDSGRITIPIKERRKHGIKDGTPVQAIVTVLVPKTEAIKQ